MTNLQNFLEHSDQADFLQRRLQGLRWKLDNCALWKKSIPVAQDLLREPEKSLSSPERIGFRSVETVWFSFHWLFSGLLRWVRSAGCMLSSATGIFLSLLHAKVGRERLVYFIVSNHSVLNPYFIKCGLGLNLRSTKFDLLVTFFTFKDIDSIFWWLFCTLRISTCHQLFNVTIARLNNISLVSFRVK